MEEMITLISQQGYGLVITGVLLVGAVKGIPMFFKWLGEQWEELKEVFKNYIAEQVRTMKEIRESNREITEINREIRNSNVQLISQVFTIGDKVDKVVEEVDGIKTKIEIVDTKIDKVVENIKF